MQDMTKTCFVAVDTHKYSHTAVAVDCLNAKLFTQEFNNENIEDFLSKLPQLTEKQEIIFA